MWNAVTSHHTVLSSSAHQYPFSRSFSCHSLSFRNLRASGLLSALALLIVSVSQQHTHLSHPLSLALVIQTLVSQHILPLLTTKMYLQKRDGNMGFDIAPALIIFLVILGAGALVCCGFAVARFMGGEPEDESSRFHRTPEQDSYMREVRERSWRKLPQLRLPKPYYQSNGGNMAHAPMSPR